MASDRKALLGWWLLTAAGLVLCLRLALTEWFLADDFMLLMLVQHGFDPWASLFPIAKRMWWAYRPLGTDLYFYWGHAAFGYDASRFHLMTLAVHALNAVALGLVGRRLGLGNVAAHLAGLIYLTAYPLSANLMRAATFHYQAATLCLLASLYFHLRWLGTKRFGSRVSSVGAVAVGLLCNRLVLLMTGLSVVSTWLAQGRANGEPKAVGGRARLLAATRGAAPFVLVLLVSIVLERWVFKPVPTHRWYGLFLDENTFARFARLMRLLVGTWPGGWLALLLLALGAWQLHRAAAGVHRGNRATEPQSMAKGCQSAPYRDSTPLTLGDGSSVTAIWLTTVLVLASVVFYTPHVRFVFPAVAPMALLLAALVQRTVRTPVDPTWARVRTAWIFTVAICWIPWTPLWRQAGEPTAGPLRAAHELVKARDPGPRTRVLFVYGGPGLADEDGFEEYRFLSYRFGHLRLLRPRRHLRVAARNVASGMPELEPDDIIIGLAPDFYPMRLDPAGLRLLAEPTVN